MLQRPAENAMPNPPNLSRHEIAEIAHELRSPLGGFEAMLDLLSQTALDTEQARLVEALEASAQHLRAILGRVLPAHERDDAVPPALGSLVEMIAASAAARAAGRGLGFECAIDPALDVRVAVESVPLRQVLENLIDNAIRASQSGTIRLSVAPGPEGRLTFALADQGPGLDPAVAEKLMMSGSGERRGLGLSIAARLVGQRGGCLMAERNGMGPGTVFRFDWPAKAQTQGHARLLIVDDHPASRLVLRTILTALGFDVTEADGISAARAYLDRENFAAVLSDLNMPEGGGRVLLEHIAGMPLARRPRAIVVSADDPRESLEFRGLVDQVVMKPLAIPALVTALRGIGLEPRPSKAA